MNVATIGYAIGTIGVGGLIFALVLMSTRTINYRAFNAIAQKLIGSGNVDRLYKLCIAAGPKRYTAALRAAIDAGETAAKAPGADRLGIGEATTGAFDAAIGPLVAGTGRIVLLGVAFGVLAVAGGALALSAGYGRHKPNVPLGLSSIGLGAMFTAMLVSRRPALTKGVAAARHHLLPGIVDAIAQKLA